MDTIGLPSSDDTEQVDGSEQVELISFSRKTDHAGEGGQDFPEGDKPDYDQFAPTDDDSQVSLSPTIKLFRKLKSWSNLKPDSGGKVELKKEITVITGVGLVIGQIIGSGIFITPRTILCLTGSFGTSLAAWVIGAIVSLAGALCYVEVGLLVRRSGGEYSYVLEAYSFKKKNRWLTLLGSLLAFLVTWSLVFFIKASSLAIITLACGRYLTRPFFIGCEVPEDAVRLMALSVLTVLTILNCYSVKLVVRLMTVLSVLKLIAVAFIVAVGVITLVIRRSVSEDIHRPFQGYEGHELTPSSLALSFYSVMWAYDGWNGLNYSIEETKNVEKTLPRALFIGVPIVAMCYLLVNFAFFSVLSYEEILSAEAVALPFGLDTLGKAGLFVIPLLVALSTFGAAMGSMFTSIRIINSSSKDGLLPELFSGVHNKYMTPVPAVLLISVLAVVLISVGSISQLINGFGAASFVFYMLVFLGLLIMRFTHRKQPRPYKAWFIVPVALFTVLFSAFLIFVPVLQAEGRVPTLSAFGVILLGVPVYIFLVMERPWKLRPKIIDRFSGMMADETIQYDFEHISAKWIQNVLTIMTEHTTQQDGAGPMIELVNFGQLHEDPTNTAAVLPVNLSDSEQELLNRDDEASQSRSFTPISAIKQTLSKRFLRKSSALSSEDESKTVLRKELTLVSGVGFVVGQNIGSAIFITPSTILCLTGSFGVSFILWLLCAGVALSAAICYIELGLLVRKSGAEYAYLLEAYSFKRKNRWCELLGSMLAFLFSWSAVFYFRAASLAVISLACARYLTRPFFIGCDVPENVVRLLGLCVLIVLALINCYSVKLAARVMTFFSMLKVVALVFIVAVGIVTVIIRGSFPADLHDPFKPLEGHTPSVPTIATALYGVIFAYDAWNVLNYSTEEARNVKRTLPLSQFIGVPIVAVCYLLVNFAFFSVLSYEEILSAEAVALPFGYSALGRAGLVIIPLLVAVSTFGAANGNLFNSARLIFATSRDGNLPRMFSGIHTSFRTPVPAVLLITSVSAVMVSTGTVYALISGLVSCLFVFYLLVFVGLLIMRVTHRKVPRIYKGWIVIPNAILMVGFSIFIIIAPLLHNPRPALISFGVILLGVPAYIFLVMERPWKLRPKILDRISDRMTIFTNNLLNTHTAAQYSSM